MLRISFAMYTAIVIAVIAGLALFGADLALSGDAALQLRLNLVAASLFEWISASTGD